MKKTACIAVATALAGCAPGVGALPPPAPRLMQTPAPLRDEQAGQDLVLKHEQLRADYAQCTSRLKGLQGYVRAAAK